MVAEKFVETVGVAPVCEPFRYNLNVLDVLVKAIWFQAFCLSAPELICSADELYQTTDAEAFVPMLKPLAPLVVLNKVSKF